MRRRRCLATLIAALACVLSTDLSSQGQTPPVSPSASTTSAVLFGQVVDADTGDPIEDALVTLTGRPTPARRRNTTPQAGASLFDLMATLNTETASETAASAANGRFVFRGLPSSGYSVRARAAGYVDAAPGLSGPASVASVFVREGQTSARVTLRLRKQAVVTGTVVDEAGEPVIGASVRAYRRSVNRFGALSFDTVDRGSTDDRGNFRLSGLAPGQYLFYVPQSQSTSPAAAADAFMQSLLGGRMPEGGLGAIAASGASPMDPRAIRVGEWRLLSDNVQSPAAGDGTLQVYRTQFYSAATNASDATWLTLKSGEERTGIDFAIQPVGTGRITGTIAGASGQIGGVPIRLLTAGERRAGDPPPLDVATGQTLADGRFTLLGVPAGQYRLVAKRDPPRDLPADLPEELASNPIVQLGLNMQRGAQRSPLYGEATVSLGQGDTAEVTIPVGEGVTLTGRLEFQDGDAPPKNELARTSVTLRPLEGTVMDARFLRSTADATFNAPGMLPGRYGFRAPLTAQGAPWLIKKVTNGGRDITTAALVIEDKPAEVVITLTRQSGMVRGTARRDSSPARDARNSTPPPLSAIAIPANYTDWTDFELLVDRVQLTRVADDGTFRMGPMLTGDYLIAVVDESQIDPSGGLAVVQSLAAQATRVTVGPGENSISVNVARLPR